MWLLWLMPSLVACERPLLSRLGSSSFLGTEVPKVPQAEPIAGSETWPADASSDRCTPRNAYACGDGQHCCCRFGCSYDLEKDSCTACDNGDPLVRNFHIPSSHLWKNVADGRCTQKNSHRCGKACCCNADFEWNLETRNCETVQDVASVEKPTPEAKAVPREDVVPGSQTWALAKVSCESRNAYTCKDGQHCCCRLGCVFSPEKDSCSGCSADSPDVQNFHIPSSHLWGDLIKDGICSPEHSHACGKACCCHAEYRWDLELRTCVAADNVKDGLDSSAKILAPPKSQPIPGSQTWLLRDGTCEARNSYKCGDHCCCMFGCEFSKEQDACTSCNSADPLVAKFHIPASHLWASRREKQQCDEPSSHRCGHACCCNADYLWDMETRRCTIFEGNAEKKA